MDNQRTHTLDLHHPVAGSSGESLSTYWSDYRKSLTSKIEQIETLIASSDENKLENLKRLYVKCYHLAGTSGTYGMTGVSEEAGKMVSLLQPVVDTDKLVAPDLFSNLEKGIQALRAVALEASTQDLDFETPKAPLQSRFAANTSSQPSEVFLVDGDPDFSKFMMAYLEKLGHRVYPFANPEDLLTIAQGIRPKAIIIDLVFQDGMVEGARIIKKVQRHQDSPVPVIFTSFRDDVQARVLAAGAKGTYFFKKPIDKDRLLLTLDRIAFKPQSFNARVLLVNSHLARGDKQLEAFQKSEVETMLLRDPLQLFDAMGQYKPDQIVIDTAQLNSFQLVRAVRQHEAYQDIPITILSAVPFDAGALLAAEAGADTLIPSSISPDHMVRILKARTERIKSTVPEATIWEG